MKKERELGELAGKCGPKMQERWAVIGDITIGTETEVLRIELEDVAQRDMRAVADELVCSGYAESSEVSETSITLINYDMLMGDADTIQEAVTELLEEYNYRIIESEREE